MTTQIEHTKINHGEQLLSNEEVQAKLSIGRHTVYALTKEGKLPVVRLRRKCLRYKLSDVEKLISGSAVKVVQQETGMEEQEILEESVSEVGAER